MQIEMNQTFVGREGLELHILHRLDMDSIDLDPIPISGIGSENYWTSKRFMDGLGENYEVVSFCHI